MVQTNEDSKIAAVYVAFKSFQTAIEILEQGLPPKIDTSVWPTMAGGVRAQLISAFKFLGLIDAERNTQSDLELLVKEKERRAEVLRDILERSYPTIVKLGSTSASTKQLEDAMREQYNVAGDTLEKAIRFYLQAAEFASIPLSPLWKKRKKATRVPSERKKGKSTRRNQGTRLPPPPPPTNEQNMMIVQMPSGGVVRLSITADLTKMSLAERTFLFDLIDKMRGFEGGEA